MEKLTPKEFTDKVNEFSKFIIFHANTEKTDAYVVVCSMMHVLENVFRVNDNDNEVCVEIADNGGGIEEDEKARVFDRFVQIKKMVGPGEHGTGLGLPIARSLIEMHGGRIWLESRSGQGSNFFFTLPKSGVQETDEQEQMLSLKVRHP